MISKSEFLAGVADLPVVLADRKRVMTQDDKIAVICDKGLTMLWSDQCKLTVLEAACEEAGLSGRIVVQLGAGLGGKGGLFLHRDKEGDLIMCRNNVLILTRRLGDAGLVAWQEKNGVSAAELRAWFDGLPAL